MERNYQFHGLSHSYLSVHLSAAQRDFLLKSSYRIYFNRNKKINRNFKIIGYEDGTGSLLVLENCSSGDHNFNRIYLLAPDGCTEKFKRQKVSLY